MLRHTKQNALLHTVYEEKVRVKRSRKRDRTVIEDSGVCQQQRDEFGLLLQLHGVLALVGHQHAHVDGEVHLVRKPRQQGQHQFVVVTRRDKIRRQPVALAEIVCQSKVTQTHLSKKKQNNKTLQCKISNDGRNKAEQLLTEHKNRSLEDLN